MKLRKNIWKHVLTFNIKEFMVIYTYFMTILYKTIIIKEFYLLTYKIFLIINRKKFKNKGTI